MKNGLKKRDACTSGSASGRSTLVIVPSRLGLVSLDAEGEESDTAREGAGDASVGHNVEGSNAQISAGAFCLGRSRSGDEVPV